MVWVPPAFVEAYSTTTRARATQEDGPLHALGRGLIPYLDTGHDYGWACPLPSLGLRKDETQKARAGIRRTDRHDDPADMRGLRNPLAADRDQRHARQCEVRVASRATTRPRWNAADRMVLPGVLGEVQGASNEVDLLERPGAASRQAAQGRPMTSKKKRGGAIKKPSGFARMEPELRREIAREGGRAAHAKGGAHEFTPEEARRAGAKGGRTVSRDREHMAEIGRKGGRARSRPTGDD